MNSKSKICFVSGGINRSGGTERVGTMIANELVKRGHDVTILSIWNHGESFFPLNPEIHVDFLFNDGIEGKLYRTYIYAIEKFRRYFKKNKFDIVVDIDTELARFTAYALHGLPTKHLSWEHFNYQHTLADKKRIRCLNLVKKYSDKLIVLTKQDLEMHLKVGVPRQKLVQIYNPTPFENAMPSVRSEKTFMSIGRPFDTKGYDLLLQAWKEVEKELPDWSVQIIGDEQDEWRLNEIISSNNLERVCLIGKTAEPEKYYDTASIYLLTSRYEGFPTVLLEAMSKGLPVISFNCMTGPQEQVVQGETGELIEPLNIEALAETMIKLARNRQKQNQYAAKALIEVQKFNIQEIGNKWEKVIREIKSLSK
ncbi:MAG: glycosyltransferase family 4 protein [Streptococcaceae bacterium]|jgi:glycosyltransferase involved in cell wall biosynthesis|nr:glycosyltransferase family 4 protein [Streptococcaceae bacterium]